MGPFSPLSFHQRGQKGVSHCVCVSEQVSGSGIFNLPHCQSTLFISPTVAKLFIYLQMDASQELSISIILGNVSSLKRDSRENIIKDDKRAE